MSIELKANVPDVKFSVDGQPATPPIILEPGQEHVIQASREGYQTGVQRVTTAAGKATAPIEFVLTPLLPRLQLLSDVKDATVSIGDQPAVPLQTGSLAVEQIAAGTQVVKVFSGSSAVLELSLKVEPGKAVELAGPLQAKGYSVAVASVLGERARMFTTSDLKGSTSGQDPQPIPPEGTGSADQAGRLDLYSEQ